MRFQSLLLEYPQGRPFNPGKVQPFVFASQPRSNEELGLHVQRLQPAHPPGAGITRQQAPSITLKFAATFLERGWWLKLQLFAFVSPSANHLSCVRTNDSSLPASVLALTFSVAHMLQNVFQVRLSMYQSIRRSCLATSAAENNVPVVINSPHPTAAIASGMWRNQTQSCNRLPVC